MSITCTDLFCGAGGSSLGAAGSGLTIDLAANHWSTAIDVHQAHFPETRHDCADISQVDPRRYPRTDILLASPECFTAGHLVTTERGQVPIEEIVVGDVVLTHRGRWRPVIRTQRRRSATIMVQGQGHPGIECTPTHGFWARTSRRVWDQPRRDYTRRYAEPEWVQATGLVESEAVWSTPIDVDHIPTLDPPLVFGLDSAAAWWLVGRWVGDGSLTFGRNHEVLISCGFHETDFLAERISDTGARWAESRKRTATVFRVGDRKARDWLHEHFGHGAAEKGLPSWVLSLPIASRQALLDGYMSADGGVTQRRARAVTVSRRLAVSVRLLAESLGHRVAVGMDRRTTYSIEGRTGAALPQWILHWEPQLSPKRAPEAFVGHGHAWSRVRRIHPGSARVDVYNIEVDEDHSYVLDGIVVRNCTNHSQARGVSRRRQDPTLWDAPDPSAERSRATMWDVVRFAEQMKYSVLVVENVVEATKWVLWPAWCQALEDLGYRLTLLSHNSQDHAVPQSRDRIYAVWTRDGIDVDLEMERTARCPRCDQARTVRQAWKNGRTVGRYGPQWFWACTTCGKRCEPDKAPAADIIDWERDCPRIGDRKRPLAEKTRARILAGLQRYGWAPITTAGAGNTYETTPGNRARGIDEPLPVQQTTATTAMATPPGFLFNTAHGGRESYVGAPHPTVCASDDRQSLIVPLRSNGHAHDACQPIPTVTAGGNHHALLMRNNGVRGGHPARHTTPITEPARTMTTTGHQSLLVPYNGKGNTKHVDEPLGTQPTRDRWALVGPDEIVDDCGFRMLEPYEVAAAMAFPDGYIPRDLPKKTQVKLAGNAVTPPVMRWITGRIAQALEEAA